MLYQYCYGHFLNTCHSTLTLNILILSEGLCYAVLFVLFKKNIHLHPYTTTDNVELVQIILHVPQQRNENGPPFYYCFRLQMFTIPFCSWHILYSISVCVCVCVLSVDQSSYLAKYFRNVLNSEVIYICLKHTCNMADHWKIACWLTSGFQFTRGRYLLSTLPNQGG